MIICHDHPKYVERWKKLGSDRWNGAYYYSVDIVNKIIPNIKTDRNWVTINIDGECLDHSIVFIHNNVNPERYDWLKEYNDLILVCGVMPTVPKVAHLGKTIYLPLSIDVEEVAHYRTDKQKNIAFVGRREKRMGRILPYGIDYIEGVPRESLLRTVALYKKIYAVGRTAIEGKVLGCEILPYDKRYPNPDIWKVVDTSEAVKILQMELDRIDNNNI